MNTLGGKDVIDRIVHAHKFVDNSPWLVFGLLITASSAIWWHALIDTLRLSLASDAHTHILLIVPLSCALIYTERSALLSTSRKGAAWATILLVASLILLAITNWGSAVPYELRLSLSVFALILWWIGSFGFCFGVSVFHAYTFPLLLLLWIVPIPNVLVNWCVEHLQLQSANAARMLFHIARVPVTQDGILLSIPNLDIEVASQCSSIRSSLMLAITTLMLADLFLRSWWRRSLLVLAAIPLSAIKNGLRIFVIAELGTRVDPGFLTGRLHRQGGILFLGIAIGVIVALLWILRRGECHRELQVDN